MENKEIVQKAAKFATHMHARQFRKEIPIPYVTHCFEVMKKVSQYTSDPEIWAAALLHDVLEDTYATEKHLEDLQFGPRIIGIVKECTRGEDEDKWEYMKSFADKSLESILVKIADRHCNVQDFKDAAKSTYYSKYALQGLPVYKAYTDKSPASFPEVVSNTSAVESSLLYFNRCIFANIQIRDVRELGKIPLDVAREAYPS